jgi:hypothetical protein
VLRTNILAAALAASVWFQFAQDRSAFELWGFTRDVADSRPAHRVLFLGNSRTYWHHMPLMVREIADSAGDTEKYQVITVALPGATFEDLTNSSRVARTVEGQWDDVILQGQSNGQWTKENAEYFEQYGEKLARTLHPVRNRPWLTVNWAYDDSEYRDPKVDRPNHLKWIRWGHDRLARASDLREVDVGRIWEKVRNDHPAIRLTEDGNHPTVAGSYLYALAVYAQLSRRSVANISYVPAGLDKDEADVIRHVVADFS